MGPLVCAASVAGSGCFVLQGVALSQAKEPDSQPLFPSPVNVVLIYIPPELVSSSSALNPS